MFPFSARTYPRRVLLSINARFVSTTTASAEHNPLLQQVYVHHVSQTVLQHMQEHQSTWLCRHGLDRGLQLTSNGTFCLSFPSRPGYDAGRIWTSYDAAKKQHWLSVYRHDKILGRFLLLDSRTRSKQHSFEMIDAMRRQIASTVDHMMEHVDQHERERQK